MPSTNKTTKLNLSQFAASDTPGWLTDYNSDMAKIDAALNTYDPNGNVAAAGGVESMLNAAIVPVQTTAEAAMPKAGGTFTGPVTAQNANVGAQPLRNIGVCNSSWVYQPTSWICMMRK